MAKMTVNKSFLVVGLLLGAASALAHADCLRAAHAPEANGTHEREPRPEAAVLMTDPAMDGLFAHYADLHRDAVGYAMADLPGSSMVAKAATEARTPITR